MVFHSEFESHLVVYPPPDHQGSVLGRIVSGDSRLGQLLYWIAFCNANARLLASVQAELATLRVRGKQGRFAPWVEIHVDRCKHGLLPICCAVCKEQNSGGCVDARGTGKAYKERKKHKKDHPITKDVLYPSERVERKEASNVAFPHVASESPERLSQTLQTLFHAQPRFTQVTPEDVAWAERQPSLRSITVRPKKVSELWCQTCIERTVLTTIADAQITFDRHGMYKEQTHDCGTHLLGDETLPTLDYREIVKRQAADLRSFQTHQRTRSKEYQSSKEVRYFQFVKEDLLSPKSEEQTKQFWLEMDHVSSVKGKRHYVRHGASDLSFVRKQDLELATEV